MDYSVRTKVLLGTNFNDSEFNELMWESAKPHFVQDIKSVIEQNETLCQCVEGNLTFCFPAHNVELLYNFVCNDENAREAESFSKSCVEDIRGELESRGYSIKRITCKAEEMDMTWLDTLEDMIFGR